MLGLVLGHEQRRRGRTGSRWLACPTLSKLHQARAQRMPFTVGVVCEVTLDLLLGVAEGSQTPE